MGHIAEHGLGPFSMGYLMLFASFVDDSLSSLAGKLMGRGF